ncbi:Glycosyltransferase, catalytic subunit of cellulose synthase and poly-beta-1,6-N-acetylglucosamine synthase [Paenibacillus sophorae]|uniref:Glycosyltransferase family 2 protein n=1 Tax=Paenibacillus sophorae TaxID=1333845 RepID=A0A1H8K2I7_9BACL|nr:glycosyltransferase family 2 protein [Paenibacillus sophorae]QWU13573.1 glycosyltransferase family 2 protein [Paenibacillus sophorae]SEN87011.1 Glycosyltransferase, catalytic subunit of cellulose synthase and poly-beta-1,6-N-acetylglucosamine synthase [Paenibacillus sophorae]
MEWLYWLLSGLNALMWGGVALLYTAKVGQIGQLYKTEAMPIEEPPLISVIIAARNEHKALERCIRSLAGQTYSNLEIIAVDDRSTDNTQAIIEEMAAKYPNVSGVYIQELPEHWMGKSHALYEGVKLANGEWLLFTDGDILFQPECVSKAEAYCRKGSLDHLTLIPDFHGNHLFSKLYGAFIFLSASSFGMLWKVKNPKAPQSLGVGAFNLVKRSTYEKIGTHASFSYVTTDDNALGKKIKQAGCRQDAVYGTRMIVVWNWYESLGQLIGSVEKSVFSFRNALTTTLSCLLTMLYPWAGLFIGPMVPRILCAVSLLSVFWLYFVYARHAGGGRWYGIAHPLIGLCLMFGGLRGAFRASRRGGMTWRGTTYDLKNLKS